MFQKILNKVTKLKFYTKEFFKFWEKFHYLFDIMLMTYHKFLV